MKTVDYEAIYFVNYAMELFVRAGHIASSTPEFANHSAEQFLFFDNSTDKALSKEQRSLFRLFDNVSRLFTEKGCVFLSINLLTSPKYRSQVAHDVHTMIHPIVGEEGSVCLFRFEEEVMLSFVGFGFRCVLSDWYPMADDYDQLLHRLDIANLSVNTGAGYFTDMLYYLARNYYFSEKPTPYELVPVDYVEASEFDTFFYADISEILADEFAKQEREYGNDYVEYDDYSDAQTDNISVELENMLLEIDDFDEEYLEEPSEFEEDENEEDEYEFDNVDPDVFRDPTLLVKWLQKSRDQQDY